MPKHIDGQKLEQDNLVLKEAGAILRKERDSLQVRHDKQLFRLRFFEQALELSREKLVSVFDDWNHPSRLISQSSWITQEENEGSATCIWNHLSYYLKAEILQ